MKDKGKATLKITLNRHNERKQPCMYVEVFDLNKEEINEGQWGSKEVRKEIEV